MRVWAPSTPQEFWHTYGTDDELALDDLVYTSREFENHGTMILAQPDVPVPLLVRFPFPAWATRASEVQC